MWLPRSTQITAQPSANVEKRLGDGRARFRRATEGEAMRPEHIQRRRVGGCSAALPGRAAGKFTDSQAAVMRVVGIEMLNKRGVCALHLKVIAAAAGVSVGTARDALNIADTIGLVTAGHLQRQPSIAPDGVYPVKGSGRPLYRRRFPEAELHSYGEAHAG
jgi:hypothetical protein